MEGCLVVERGENCVGLFLMWKEEVAVNLLSFSKSHIDVEVNDGHFPFRFTGMYGTPDRRKKNEDWELLDCLKRKSGLPWLLGGDLNDILEQNEKAGDELDTHIRERAEWDERLIRQVFNEEDAKAILNCPICPIEKDQQINGIGWATGHERYRIPRAWSAEGQGNAWAVLPMTPLPSSLYRARFFWSGLCIARQVQALAMPSRWGEFVTPTRPTTRGFGHVDARSRWLCAARLNNVTPNTGRPCVATVLGGVSRPPNVRASDLIKSQWVLLLRYPTHPYFIVPSGCGVPSLIVSSAPQPNLSIVWVVDRWVWVLLLVRNGHVSGEMVVCVGRLRASCIELSSRTPLQRPPLLAVEPKGCNRDPMLRT
ncbi:hypothetical protein V6N13_040418 [Hibiscus sabdariffa]